MNRKSYSVPSEEEKVFIYVKNVTGSNSIDGQCSADGATLTGISHSYKQEEMDTQVSS